MSMLIKRIKAQAKTWSIPEYMLVDWAKAHNYELDDLPHNLCNQLLAKLQYIKKEADELIAGPDDVAWYKDQCFDAGIPYLDVSGLSRIGVRRLLRHQIAESRTCPSGDIDNINMERQYYDNNPGIRLT